MAKWTDDYIGYEELLDIAYDKGLIDIRVNLVQFPTEHNGHQAVAVAEAIFERIHPKTGEVKEGTRVFREIGDADPSNVNNNIKPHIIRQAATRAKVRALRDAVNIGKAAREEFGGVDTEVQPQRKPERNGDAQKGAAKDAKPEMITREQREEIAELAEELYPKAEGPPSGVAALAQKIKESRGVANWSINKLTKTNADRLIDTLQEQADSKFENDAEDEIGLTEDDLENVH